VRLRGKAVAWNSTLLIGRSSWGSADIKGARRSGRRAKERRRSFWHTLYFWWSAFDIPAWAGLRSLPMRRDVVLTYRWHHNAIHLSARVGNPLEGASSANRMRNEDFDTASRHRRRACLAAPWFGGAGRRQVSRLERDYQRRDFEITGLRRLESERQELT
jgi:hypothetical protein